MPSNRETCKKYYNDPHKKCRKFYANLKMFNNIIIQCPYGFTTLKIANTILTSTVTSNSNLKKIVTRNKYSNYKDDLEPLNLNELKEKLKSYNQFYNQNILTKSLIHDIGNAMNYLLAIKNSVSNKIEGFELLSEHYRDLSEKISDLRKKTTHNFFELQIDYKEQHDSIEKDITTLRLNAKSFADNGDFFKDKYLEHEDKDDINRSFYEGFSLILTLIEYYEKVNNPSIIIKNRVPLRPHKMFKKLSRLLEYRAKRENVKIVFMKNNDIEVMNSPDLFIVMFTLLDNAIKFSVPGSMIEICFENIDDTNIIEISNKYIGKNDPNLINNIYKKGVVGNNPKTGSGFGLFLVEQIINSTNCRIQINPTENQWNTRLIIPSTLN